MFLARFDNNVSIIYISFVKSAWTAPNLGVYIHVHFPGTSIILYRPDDDLPELSWSMLEKSYPNYPDLKDLQIRPEDLHCLMDIAAYVQIGPHAINGKLCV